MKIDKKALFIGFPTLVFAFFMVIFLFNDPVASGKNNGHRYGLTHSVGECIQKFRNQIEVKEINSIEAIAFLKSCATSPKKIKYYCRKIGPISVSVQEWVSSNCKQLGRTCELGYKYIYEQCKTPNNQSQQGAASGAAA